MFFVRDQVPPPLEKLSPPTGQGTASELHSGFYSHNDYIRL